MSIDIDFDTQRKRAEEKLQQRPITISLLQLIIAKTQEGFAITFRNTQDTVLLVGVSKDDRFLECQIDGRRAAINDDAGLICSTIEMQCKLLSDDKP